MKVVKIEAWKTIHIKFQRQIFPEYRNHKWGQTFLSAFYERLLPFLLRRWKTFKKNWDTTIQNNGKDWN